MYNSFFLYSYRLHTSPKLVRLTMFPSSLFNDILSHICNKVRFFCHIPHSALSCYVMYPPLRIILNIFTALKIYPVPHIFRPLLPNPPEPLANTDQFTVSTVLPLLECHVRGIIQYMPYLDWLFSLSNMCLSFIQLFYWFDN